jgi:excisionase family DNA binding protein
MATQELNIDHIISPDPAEQPEMERLRDQIDEIFRRHGQARLVGPDGQALPIPESVFRALVLVAQDMAQGKTIVLMPHGKMLTTQEAADLLNISRPYLVKMLEKGDIPFELVGSHRRLRVEDVLAYRRTRALERRSKLDRLTQLSEETDGGYV